MDFELTGDEITEAIQAAMREGCNTHSVGCYISVSKAAQRKLLKRLYEKCYKHDGGLLRLGCPECLRELRKEFGL